MAIALKCKKASLGSGWCNCAEIEWKDAVIRCHVSFVRKLPPTSKCTERTSERLLPRLGKLSGIHVVKGALCKNRPFVEFRLRPPNISLFFYHKVGVQTLIIRNKEMHGPFPFRFPSLFPFTTGFVQSNFTVFRYKKRSQLLIKHLIKLLRLSRQHCHLTAYTAVGLQSMSQLA